MIDLSYQHLMRTNYFCQVQTLSFAEVRGSWILDICFTVSMVSSYLVEPHWIGAKNLLRHLRGTISHGLRYTAGNMKTAWLFKCWLGRKCGGSLEHFSVLVLFGFCFDIMDEQEAEVGCYKYRRDQIHNYEYDLVWNFLVVETFQWVHMMNTTMILCDNQRWDSIIEESCIRRLLQQIDIRYYLIWDMVSRWARRLRHTEMMYRSLKPRGKDQICDFPERLRVVKRPLYKGPTCCIHWALRALGACGSYWTNIRPQGDSPSPSGVHWNKMIRSFVG